MCRRSAFFAIAAIVTIVAVGRTAHAQWVKQSSADPYAGIHTERWRDEGIPATLRLVKIDLSSAAVELFATKPSDRGMTTSQYAALKGGAIAINGDSFTVGNFQPTGLAVGENTPWAGTTDDGSSAVFHFKRLATPTGGEYTAAAMIPTGVIVTAQTLPGGTLGAISGRPMLVRDSLALGNYGACTDARTIPCDRAPRAALGLSNNSNTLWLVVVDGWTANSAGVRAAELADFFATTLQVDSAMALDGGSSATLFESGAVVSGMPDGAERVVANHLAVVANPQKPGSIIGQICRTQLNPCSPLQGVTVKLDTGSTQTSNANGVYNFVSLTPRYACVTASMTQYHPNTRCVVVGPGPNPTWDSIALKPCPTGGCPPVDAGVPDAAVEYPDAGALIDGGGRDGGNPSNGPGGGCCDAGPDHPPLLVVLLVAWWLTRRRVTTSYG